MVVRIHNFRYCHEILFRDLPFTTFNCRILSATLEKGVYMARFYYSLLVDVSKILKEIEQIALKK